MLNAFDDVRAWMEFSTYPLYEAAVRLPIDWSLFIRSPTATADIRV
jgi:hypothetical protein